MTLDEGIKAFENAKEGELVPVNPADVAYWLRALRHERQFLAAVMESTQKMDGVIADVKFRLTNAVAEVAGLLPVVKCVIELEQTEGRS